MPVLQKYKDKEKYYILTSISGKIVTFHLTGEGHEKLIKTGIKNEERFGRALLFDLYRTGDAFTHDAGPGKLEGTDKRQLALDFADDPEPERIFPSEPTSPNCVLSFQSAARCDLSFFPGNTCSVSSLCHGRGDGMNNFLVEDARYNVVFTQFLLIDNG